MLAAFCFLFAAVPEIEVHFVVLIDAPPARKFTSRAAMDEALQTINERMVAEDGEALVKLKLASVTSYAEASASSCDIVKRADEGRKWFDEYSKCPDPKLRHPGALNFLIYKSPGSKMTSFGGTVHGKPFLTVDYRYMSADRLLTHETGHAFGLKHVCPNGPISNIMNSKAGCSALPNGEAGKHFAASQVSTIRERVAKALRLFKAQQDDPAPDENDE